MWGQELENTQGLLKADDSFALPHFEGFEAVEALAASSQEAGWGDTEYRQLSRGDLFATSKYQVIDASSIILESASQRLQVVGVSPEHCMTLLIPLPGTRIRLNCDEFTENDFFALPPGAEIFSVTPRNARVVNLHISEEYFEGHAEKLLSGEKNLFGGRCQAYKNDTLVGELRRNLIHALYRQRDTDFDLIFESELVSRLIQFMASRSGSEYKPERLTYSARQRALSRALEFVEEYYFQSLKMTELCNHANVSLSTLERIFTREMQVTPVKYLKLRRLHAVRSEIANPQDTRSIAEIATRNGFTHLGRFSAAYKNQFGVLPKIERRNSVSI